MSQEATRYMTAKDALRRALAQDALSFSRDPIALSGGGTSNYYVDCRRALSVPETLKLVGEAVARELDPLVRAVGGLTMGADPIAIATSMSDYANVSWFSVRKVPKHHGTEKWIEGWLDPQSVIAIVDDVITTGASIEKAAVSCLQEGHMVHQVVALVGRDHVGIDRVQRIVSNTIVLFTLEELIEEATYLQLAFA